MPYIKVTRALVLASIALMLLGVGMAAAMGGPTERTVSPGVFPQLPKQPNAPGPSVAAAPNYTVTLGAWRNLRPTESALNGVSLLPASYNPNCSSSDQKSKGWAVGDSGVILNYCNGVWDHAIIAESIPTNLYGVQAISPTLGVAVGDQGTVAMYLYESIATNWVWTKSPIPVGNQRLNSVSMTPDGSGNFVGWSVGATDPNVSGRGTLVQGTIYAPVGSPGVHTYSWTNVTGDYALPAVLAYYGVHTIGPSNAWAVGATSSGGIIIHWDGSQWTVFATVADPLYALQMKSSTEGWAVGKSGATYHYDGTTWTEVSSPATKDLLGVDYAPNNEVWAVGWGNTQLKYSGGVWQQTPPEQLRTDAFELRSVDFTSGHGWAVGGHQAKGIGGQILEYDNGLWLAVTPPTDNQLNAISVISDNDAWAVGAADSSGGTIIHWDGRHWQRWFQLGLPIPSVDLYAIKMNSPSDGWAAGDPPTAGAPAVFLHWDGIRWSEPRYDAPVNVRVNALDMKDSNFGWTVEENGNAFAKYDGAFGYWNALHSDGGAFYQLFGLSITDGAYPWGNWDAWAVGKRRADVSPFNPTYAVFMRFWSTGSGNAWQEYQSPKACGTATDGPMNSKLYGIKMLPGAQGYASGEYGTRATIYTLVTTTWQTKFCQLPNGGPSISNTNPSRFYSVDVTKDQQVPWIGGFEWNDFQKRKWAYITYLDATGVRQAGDPYPVNGVNIYHRPIRAIAMSSETMGWAVGDPEDTSKKSVIYQYPYPNFTLDTFPAGRAVLPGGSTFFTATANSIGGFSADVSVSLLSLPPNISGSVTPPTLNATSMSTINITTTGGIGLGTYYLPLLGYTIFRSGDNDIPVARVSYLKLTVTNTPVYSVTPSHGPAGTVVTVTGTNFGSDPGVGNRSTVSNHVSWGGVQMPSSSILSWSNTQITFQPPDNPSLFTPAKFPPSVGSVVVTAAGNNSNDDYTFHMDNVITNISRVVGPSTLTVTLTGTSFGNDPGSLLRSTMYEHVSLNGAYIPNSSIVSWSNHQIVFTVPVSSPGGLVTVTSNGFESNAVVLVPRPTVYLPLIRR